MFLALANDVKDRGTIVAQGGGKVRDHRANTNTIDTKSLTFVKFKLFTTMFNRL